ncbi:uncharacterized protein LOC144422865 [Styela clava]
MLQTDWSKDGVGYLLLQQHCACPTAKDPTCCKDGWKLVFAGSRFTNEAESRYPPSEGEAFAIGWGLKHSRFFTREYPHLIVSTDHRPPIAIFLDRSLDKINNPRLLRLKEHTFAFRFTIQHNPGKWRKRPDALSRCPISTTESDNETIDSTLFHFFTSDDTSHVLMTVDEDLVDATHHTIAAFHTAASNQMHSNQTDWVTHKQFIHACKADKIYLSPIHQIQPGFPRTRSLLSSDLKQYWEVRDRLSVINNIIMLDTDRIVVPPTYYKPILANLHSAHQGTSGMYARAKNALYWPGMNAAIRNTRYNCQKCNNIAPQQIIEPITGLSLPTGMYESCASAMLWQASHAIHIESGGC